MAWHAHTKECQGCQFRKLHRLPFKSSSNRKSVSFELVHKTRTISYNGYQYVMILIDDFFRFMWVYFMKEKSETLSKFNEFNNLVAKQEIKCLRSDNDGEFMSNAFSQYCYKNHIQQQMTCPNTPQQNGVSERKLYHLRSYSLAWMHDKNLPREFWVEAFQCACHVVNRLPPRPGKEKSPFELFYDDKPNVSMFRVFGSTCYVHVPKDSRTKLDLKANKYIFVGYKFLHKRMEVHNSFDE